MAERRTDPLDGGKYTFQELTSFYKGKYKKAELQKYWDNTCIQAKAKAKATSKPKFQPKAEPKAEAKAEAQPKAKVEAKAKAQPMGKPQFKVKTVAKVRQPKPLEEVIKRVTECKVVPVIKLEDAAHAAPLAKALKEGGIDVAEITFRSSCAAEAIREACGVDGVCVGAGTVLTPQQVDQAVNNGADFIVSPGFDPDVAQRCKARNVLYLPGVVTPTEVMMVSSKFKLKVLKFFPASNYGGAGTLKSFSAVFQDVSFMPTGGITEANIGDFVSLPNVFAAGGSWMVSDAAVKSAATSGNWSDIAAGARKASEAAKAGAAKK